MPTHRRRRLAAEPAARGRPDTRERASTDHSTCRETATCVRDPKHCEPLGDRPSSSIEPDCGPSLGVVHDTQVGGTKVSKKNFCRVTTRGRNCGVLWWLWRCCDPLTARSFGSGMPGFRGGVTPPSGLALCRLPASNLPLAFRSLTIPLVPTTRPIRGTATFTQTDTYPRSTRPRTVGTRSGTAGVSAVILGRVHGSETSERIVRGERTTVLHGRLSKRGNRPALTSLSSVESTRSNKITRAVEQNRRKNVPLKKTTKETTSETRGQRRQRKRPP